ncbi:MAG: IS1634 family transposase [Gammaproteobacteria bacterium]
MAYVRTVKTASGATAVQIVHSTRAGKRDIEHVGSAHGEVELAALKSAAALRLAGGQTALDLGAQGGGQDGSLERPMEIAASRMAHLWDALCRAYDSLGFPADTVFRDLVLARIVEPTSKLDSARVLGEIGIAAVPYRTLTRRLPDYAKQSWTAALAKACAAHASLGPATLVLYDVTTLHFEIDEGDGFREPGYSKERRLDPQITVGLLADSCGFPLMVQAFEGNRAETATMLPVLEKFMTAHQIRDLVVVADAGMFSAANQAGIEDAGLSFILGARTGEIPYVVKEWRREHPDEQMPDGLVLTQPWPASSAEMERGRRDRTIYYQYTDGRARRTLRGIDEQVAKAEAAVAGKTAVKRNRFVTLTGAEKSVNRNLEAKARALAGIKGYDTNIANPTPEFVIGAYAGLWRIEKSFRMSKHDLRARPIYHHKRESIDAHLAIVFASLAVTRLIEARTGWSIKKFVQTTRRYRTVQIRAAGQLLTAEDPLPVELRDALAQIL